MEERELLDKASKIVTVKLEVGELLMIRNALYKEKREVAKLWGQNVEVRYAKLINRLVLLIDDSGIEEKLPSDLRKGMERNLRHEEKAKTCDMDCDNCEFREDVDEFVRNKARTAFHAEAVLKG